MHFCRAAVIISLLVSVSFAQDPLKVSPGAYKLQFENEWVKVTRVHYAPNEKLPAHEHTQTAAAYVYLNDSGPVLFKHVGEHKFALTRPATKTGSFRLFRAVQEIHEVENKSELPSDFLRVEFKTEPKDETNMRGRYFREDYRAGENFLKVQFESDQIRVTRLVCAAGKKLDVATSPTEPALLVALSQAKFGRLKLEIGQTRWVDSNRHEQFENTGDAPAELLRFDLKTKPLSKEELKKKKQHEHPKK